MQNSGCVVWVHHDVQRCNMIMMMIVASVSSFKVMMVRVRIGSSV